MNHYPHHIGDFNNATRHLTRTERSLYRDLIELYYDTECPLTSDFNKLARRVIAITQEERGALEAVLDEFFFLEEDGWHNTRCDAEIEKYQSSIEQASRAGKASAAKRAMGKATTAQRPLDERATPVERPLNDRATNQNQNQNQNHTPLTPQGAAPDGAGGVELVFPSLVEQQDFAADEPVTPIDSAAPSADSADTARSVCLALKAIGISSTNSGNQNLQALINAGADLQEFIGAAQQAVASGNGRFKYVLGIVSGERRRAADLAAQLHTGAMPPAQAARPNYAQAQADIVRSTVPGRAGRDPALARIEADAAKAAPMPPEVRARLAALRGAA